MTRNSTFNAGLYIRLSREDGDNLESESIVNQRNLLKGFLNKNSKQLKYVNEYVDDGYSGSNFDRPAWKHLLQDIKQGHINTIITKDLSRMGRDYISMGQYIERIFPEQNIRYIAVNDDIDTLYETPGLEFLQFKLMFNDYYLKDTSKKIRKIIKAKKENGQFLGWKAPYGYQKKTDDKHKLIIDQAVKPIIQKMFALALKGKSPKQIADIFSKEKIPTPSIYANLSRNPASLSATIWCPRTVEAILTNETYIGNLTQGRRKKINYKSKKEIRMPKEQWIIVENTHEAIIDKHTFNTVQELLKKKKCQNKRTYLLSGFLRCKECGHAIGINQSSDHKRHYCHCTYYTSHSKYHLCTPHSLNYDKLEAAVIKKLQTFFKTIDSSNFFSQVMQAQNRCESQSPKHQEIQNLQKKITTNTKYIDTMYEDKLKDNISVEVFKRLSSKYQNEINLWKRQISDLETEIQSLKGTSNDNIKDKINEYITLTKPTRKLLVHLIDKILISEDKTIEIYYKFHFNSEKESSHERV